VASIYLTTAIDYANGDPHLGHALEKVGADAIARYHRLRGDAVHFLIGMDEHGQKVAQAAAAEGMPPQALVDRVADRFRATWAALGISNDQFIRTTDPAHARGVHSLIETIFEQSPDDFYERAYEGRYCVGCEAFKTDAEIADGHCILHPTLTLEWVAERNWFFRLSRHEAFLREHIAAHPDFVAPDSRRNEILGLLEQGLEDVSASRAHVTWGVPFPRPTSDGAPQTTYVWFDALPNYLTATGYPNPEFAHRWPAQLHVVGKDITRFHCLIWPAMLRSAGLPLPERVWAHGFLTGPGGTRFSKSSGVWIDLPDATARYGADALRYFLLREVPFDGDGAFSWERFDERYTSELANGIGNLASRTIAMVERYRGGIVPRGSDAPNAIDTADAADYARYHRSMDGSRGYLPHEALRQVWSTVARANEYVDRQAPWTLAKSPDTSAQLDDTLATLIRQLARQALHLAPFMPERAEVLWHHIGGQGSVHDGRFDVGIPSSAGWRVTKGAALFPRPDRELSAR
jgi:methionyl-tRNA synthetase